MQKTFQVEVRIMMSYGDPEDVNFNLLYKNHYCSIFEVY